MELFAPLDPEKVDWLGSDGYIGLPQSEIDRIKKDYQSPTQRKEAYLDLYIHHHPCPTWSRVAEILRRRFNHPQQADLVENTYIKGTQLKHTMRLLISRLYYMIMCTMWEITICVYYCHAEAVQFV